MSWFETIAEHFQKATIRIGASFYMINDRCADQAGIETQSISNHTFRGTGITAYLENPEGRLENAQIMAAHTDPKTTRLYDRRSDEVLQDDVERIGI